MMWTKFANVLLVYSILGSASVAFGVRADDCLTGTAPVVVNDAGQIRALRSLIDLECACSSFDGSAGRTRGGYLRCAVGVIKRQIDAGTLRSRCKAVVKRYYSKSICGIPPIVSPQPCVQRTLNDGTISCTVRRATKADGITPTGSCVDRPGIATQVTCPAFTHCIDAADTDGNLSLAAPGDTGACVVLPTPTSSSTATPTPTESPSCTATPSATMTTTPTATAAPCMITPSVAAELAVNRAKWTAAGIKTYDLDYQRSCACPEPGSGTVQVTNAEMTAVVDSGSGEVIEGAATGAFGFNSVDDVFGVIEAAISECATSIAVEYDSELGYPASVFIDFTAAGGDEVLIAINGLRVAALATFPIALGECNFDPACMDQSCMPILFNVPSSATNSAWTAFLEAPSNGNINHYFPAACGGHGAPPPRLRIGDVISLVSTASTPLLNTAKCVVESAETTFTVPLFPCGDPAQSAAVVGFARIEIDGVFLTGIQKGISLHALWGE